MKEAFDPPTSAVTTPPEMENGTSSCMRNNIRNDVVAERDSISSYRPCMCPEDCMKCEENTHFLSHANSTASHQEYLAQSSYSNYATSHGSHAYSKEAMSLGGKYCRQQPYFSSSSYSWENSSSALEAVPSSPDISGHVDTSEHVVGKMRAKSKIFWPRPDYLASYPTGPDMRRSYSASAKVDSSLDYHSEHWYRRSDRFTAFSNCKGQSIEHRNEIVDLPRGTHFVDETTSFSSRWCFDNWSPSLPRGLEYGDEIPSLSSQKCNGNKALSYSSQWEYGAEIPSLSSRQGYGAEIPSLSSRQVYGDEIPSLSRHGHYRDKIPLHSGRWCHDAEAHPLPSYQQGSSHRNGHTRDKFVSSLVSNQEVKMIRSKHTATRPRVPNRVVNSTDHYRINKKDNPWKNSEDIRDQVRGPRANKLNNASTPSTEKDIVSPLVRRDQINSSDFSVQYELAKFFMIKSYSEDDIHKGIKYNVWASTPNGNNKLNAAFHEAQILMKEKGTKCPIFLFFSVNTSGQFVGLAEMLGPVDFKKTMDFWQQDKWNGFFPVMWHIMKDIPNQLFKHITLENNNHRPVTFSRDTQEIGLPQGLEMLKIFKAYRHETSILDDFNFYEEKRNAHCARKGANADSIHEAILSFFGKEARLSDDLKSVENLEASMESMSFYETTKSLINQ